MTSTNKKLEDYRTLQQALKNLKDEEKAMRLELVEEYFPNAVSGTLSEAVGDFIIKGSFKLNYKLDTDAIHEMGESFSDEEEACIKWTPTIIMANYKELDESERENLDSCLTVSPALPALEIKGE